MLSIPKPVRITQIAAGNEGHHALLLSEDGTLFFVGSARRGEDGELSGRPQCHRFNKPSRVKKFACKLEGASGAPAFIACNHGSSAVVTKSGQLYLFGKEAFHCNSKGQVNLMSAELLVKTVALGKAHMLILTVGGMVITAGFSNKGQCGLGQTTTTASSAQSQLQQSSNIFKQPHNDSSNLDEGVSTSPERNSSSVQAKQFSSSFTKYLGHMFIFGKTRICRKCSKCTEFGAKCSYLRLTDPSSAQEDILKEGQENSETEGALCGCGDGNSGCIYCGTCSACSKDVPVCKR